jgi:hypothetical protein
MQRETTNDYVLSTIIDCGFKQIMSDYFLEWQLWFFDVHLFAFDSIRTHLNDHRQISSISSHFYFFSLSKIDVLFSSSANFGAFPGL